MSARYFTYKAGKFNENCLAVKIDSDGRAWFVKNDAERTLTACNFWEIGDAEDNVAKGVWIEVSEQYALTPELLDRPQTEADAW